MSDTRTGEILLDRRSARSLRPCLPACAVGALLAACSGGDGVPGGVPPGGPPAGPIDPLFSEIQAAVLTPNCATAGCHVGAGAPQGLRLDADSSYGLLVGVPSSEVPSVLRVAPGNPDDSYLVQKLEGSAAAGQRMPLGRQPLPGATIDVIRQWIVDGALDDRPASAKPVRVSALTPAPGDLLTAPPPRVVATFDRELDASTINRLTFTLEASGGDGTFGDGNETAIPAAAITTSAGGRRAIFEVGRTLPNDTYRVRLAGRGASIVMDLAANALDGEADGAAGGDFVAEFTLAAGGTHD